MGHTRLADIEPVPKEFRPSAWREVALLGNVVFFGFFFVFFLINLPKILRP